MTNCNQALPSGETPFDLEAWPFYWLTKANGRYLRQSETALKKAGLDAPSWRVLMMLGGNTARGVGYLSEHGAIKLPTMTRIVQRMQADGLVDCRPRVTDARVTEVTLTDNGRQARGAAWKIAHSIYDTALAGIAKTDIESVIGVMKRILANLEAKVG